MAKPYLDWTKIWFLSRLWSWINTDRMKHRFFWTIICNLDYYTSFSKSPLYNLCLFFFIPSVWLVSGAKKGVNGTRGTVGVFKSQSHSKTKKKIQINLILRNEEINTYVHWFYFPKSIIYFKVGMVNYFFEQKLGHMVGQFILCEIFISSQPYKIKPLLVTQLANHFY